MADEVWMIEVSTNCTKNKQKQCLSLCIPSGEALAHQAFGNPVLMRNLTL